MYKVPINKTETADYLVEKLKVKAIIPIIEKMVLKNVIKSYNDFLFQLKQRKYTWILVGKHLGLPKDIIRIIGKNIKEDYNGICYTQEEINNQESFLNHA